MHCHARALPRGSASAARLRPDGRRLSIRTALAGLRARGCPVSGARWPARRASARNAWVAENPLSEISGRRRPLDATGGEPRLLSAARATDAAVLDPFGPARQRQSARRSRTRGSGDSRFRALGRETGIDPWERCLPAPCRAPSGKVLDMGEQRVAVLALDDPLAHVLQPVRAAGRETGIDPWERCLPAPCRAPSGKVLDTGEQRVAVLALDDPLAHVLQPVRAAGRDEERSQTTGRLLSEFLPRQSP